MQLNHVQVQTTDLDASKHFWVDLIGLKVGDRPPFDFPGAWYYAGDIPAIHLVVRPSVGEAGAVDHVALECTPGEFDGIRDRLTQADLPFRETIVPGRGDRQLFVVGPDGIRVELRYPNPNAPRS